jgi:hypothetical protein
VLARYRWKILQLLHLHAAAFANLPLGYDEDVVLAAQRCALLIHDTSVLLRDEERAARLIEQARATYRDTLGGRQAPLAESALPKGN